MSYVATRTAVVANLDEFFWHVILANGTPPTLITARSVTQRVAFTAAATLVRNILAARGAGHTAAADVGYAVALTAMRTAADITLDSKHFIFKIGDPPGTAIVQTTDEASIDLGALPTVTSATAGDQVAIVEQPPTYSGGLISYITAVSQESPDLRRDIRDKGQLQHRKRMAVENGVMTFTAKYENAKAGLSQFVDQDFIMVGEREDDRVGVVTEKVILYGARINSIPAPNESEGDSDTDTSIAVNYELLAIVGEAFTA